MEVELLELKPQLVWDADVVGSSLHLCHTGPKIHPILCIILTSPTPSRCAEGIERGRFLVLGEALRFRGPNQAVDFMSPCACVPVLVFSE